MSIWTDVKGLIKIDGLTQEGWLKVTNTKTIEEYYDFLEDLHSGYKYRWAWEGTKLIRDFSEEIKKLLGSIKSPTGSEGDLEVEYCRCNKMLTAWGSDTTMSSSADYHAKDGRVYEFYQVPEDIPDDELEPIMVEDAGDFFAIAVFGELRDRDVDEFAAEFDMFLGEIKKYFVIRDILVEALSYGQKAVWELSDEIFGNIVMTKKNVRI